MQGVNAAQQDLDVDLGRLFASLLRDWRRIILVALGVALGAFVLASLATDHYRAETRILIEPRESVYTRATNDRDSNAPILDDEGVTSQVEVITSTDLLRSVAAELDLADRDEFNSGGVSPVARVLSLFGAGGEAASLPAEERVLKAFREKLDVYRVENSRVIVIRFSSEDPQLAARVPNAVAAAYVDMQRQAKLLSNTDATAWLEPEIVELRQQVREAERKVAEFRAQSDLLVGQNNSVLATQQLSELSSELSRVRANRASAEATAESVRAALENGTSLDTLPSVLESGLIQRLRERQVQLRADIADLSATLLDNHPRIRSLRSQLADLDAQIRQEARNVLEGLENEARAAGFRERQLLADLNRLKAESARAGEDEVELRALEREAASQRELLESYLSRFREASSRRDRNYLPVDARVFSNAIVPQEPYFPKVLPITAAAFVSALLVMAIVTLLAELFSGRAMRPAEGIEPDRESEPAGDIDVGSQAVAEARSVDLPENAPLIGAAIPGALGADVVAERLIASGASRAIFLSPEGDVAVASAVMVAREIADSGLRVLLIDLTMTGAASKPMLDGRAAPGITDLLASEAQFRDVIHADLYSDCHVMPAGNADPEKAMRAVERLPIILSSVAAAYDLVIVECGQVEAAALRRLTDDETEILVSAIAPEEDLLLETVKDLTAGGYTRVTFVTPGMGGPMRPEPDREAA
ncbi:MAG: chain-length determining protein [Rhizobiaceae bacterium]|nr:chain-length determining protein [Rhizobiaceae bacterium]MCV0405278.1 chain-length determining protein [Rhizobiaceae bacterium]